jgi:hypothetical protein
VCVGDRVRASSIFFSKKYKKYRPQTVPVTQEGFVESTVSGGHRSMARYLGDADSPPRLQGIFAGGELLGSHTLASARTHHEAKR